MSSCCASCTLHTTIFDSSQLQVRSEEHQQRTGAGQVQSTAVMIESRIGGDANNCPWLISSKPGRYCSDILFPAHMYDALLRTILREMIIVLQVPLSVFSLWLSSLSFAASSRVRRTLAVLNLVPSSAELIFSGRDEPLHIPFGRIG